MFGRAEEKSAEYIKILFLRNCFCLKEIFFWDKVQTNHFFNGKTYQLIDLIHLYLKGRELERRVPIKGSNIFVNKIAMKKTSKNTGGLIMNCLKYIIY